MNNYSIVVRLQYGDTSFLLTGDAEDISEQEILNKGYNIKADVLKVGHQGSRSSTTPAFLNKVNPEYAVIMVGDDNAYGHLHKSTIDLLKSKGIKVFRTDENGTIVATSDGKTVKFSTQPGSYSYRGDGEPSGSGNNGGGTVETEPAPQP